MFNKFVRFTPKTFAITAIVFTVIACLYYANHLSKGVENEIRKKNEELLVAAQEFVYDSKFEKFKSSDRGTCAPLLNSDADVNTVDVFSTFDFQPTWIRNQEFWDKSFDDRYERSKMDSERPPLKVIVVPHSHNDPGWLKTFEQYFHGTSKQILNLMVQKLQEHKNLTFIWSEVVFLDAWWDAAHPTNQEVLKKLAKSGRLEITTGGWVMTDEANAHVFAMVNQLIEGHQWLLKNLEIKPKTGWSVDPFGHGSTQPYLLAKSNMKGTIIQRIHYAWKQWLALKQYGDFKWIPNWSPNDIKNGILTHNQPFDIYSIKHSCGPHPYICLNFDFRKVANEYPDYSPKAQVITKENVKEKSELLLEQYAKTASLFPHNVVLVPLGDDFRYNVMQEWDQQYTNYKLLIDYINDNKNLYKTDISFGTPIDYFEEIVKRYDQFPYLKGDFFVYSDIFAEGRPAYWSGYYTTRPFIKIVDRELEAYLRGAEILYTVALNNAKKIKNSYLKLLEQDYEKLVLSRRNLALFQHHDAITGTSKAHVMYDYGLKLFEGIRSTMSVQQNAMESLLFGESLKYDPSKQLVQLDVDRDSFEKLPRKIPITIMNEGDSKQVVVYNSLAQNQEYLVQIRITSPYVKVLDKNNKEVLYQINPVWKSSNNNMKMMISDVEYELLFIAKLEALSITVYTISHTKEDVSKKFANIRCNKCHQVFNVNPINIVEPKEERNPIFSNSIFNLKRIPFGNIYIDNNKLKIDFHRHTGFMKSMTNKKTMISTQCAIQFAAYKSAQYHSGAYLFMPDPNDPNLEMDVLLDYQKQKSIIITSGPVTSEFTVIYGPFLVHTVRIFKVEGSSLSDAISIENIVDFENPPKNRETELFMRVISSLQNGDPPEFYSDSNGFQMQKRVKVERIGIEGNYFPITSMAYIQDERQRLSILTNHAQGAAAWQPGFLEVMLDRRTLYDDARGMGEGVIDNRKTITKFFLLLEDFDQEIVKDTNPKRFENEDGNLADNKNVNILAKDNYSRPSLFANHLSNALNYPVNIFTINNTVTHALTKNSIKLMNKQFPCDLHLLTLRTQPDPIFSKSPSSSSFLVLHRQSYECNLNSKYTCNLSYIKNRTGFFQLKVKSLQKMSLTGIEVEKRPGIRALHDISLEPMELQTFNVTLG